MKRKDRDFYFDESVCEKGRKILRHRESLNVNTIYDIVAEQIITELFSTIENLSHDESVMLFNDLSRVYEKLYIDMIKLQPEEQAILQRITPSQERIDDVVQFCRDRFGLEIDKPQTIRLENGQKFDSYAALIAHVAQDVIHPRSSDILDKIRNRIQETSNVMDSYKPKFR